MKLLRRFLVAGAILVVLYLGIAPVLILDGVVMIPVTVKVVSASGAPISGVRVVSIRNGSNPDFEPSRYQQGVTDSGGVAKLLCEFPMGGDQWGTWIYTGSAMIVCSAEGYQSVRVPVTQEKNVRYRFFKPSFSVNVTMEK